MEKKCKICKKIFDGLGKVSACSDKCKDVLKEQQAEKKRKYNREYKKRTAEKQKQYQKEYYKKTKNTRVRSPESIEKNRIAARERYHKKKAEKNK